ncbi:MAG: hypothetical protein HUJ76_10750, partial [Parasporobacterium sp.]|nr:hypothetical protein [Parasporobacterium sp.]
VVVKNSTLFTDSAKELIPGNDPGTLTAGTVPAASVTESAQVCMINSDITAHSMAAVYMNDGQDSTGFYDESALFAYNSKFNALHGGTGVYVGIYCNAWIFGGSVKSAEIGLFSENSGNITLGTPARCEEMGALEGTLTEEDTAKVGSRDAGTVVSAGRNALVINSTDNNDPELCKKSASIEMTGAALLTDLSLSENVDYGDTLNAYIRHTAGSVILVRSSNADITLDKCRITPASDGTGNIIHTVVSNNTQGMIKVPEGESYPGVKVNMKAMIISGDICHEDYQRDMDVTLDACVFSGSANEYDAAHWNEISSQEGFSEFCPDSSYETRHGLGIIMKSGASWEVTKESHLSRLQTESGCEIKGVVYLNGERVPAVPADYIGDIVIKPEGEEQETAEQETTVREETTAAEEAHVHSWQEVANLPSGCETEGYRLFECSCGQQYTESIPAAGHDYMYNGSMPSTCTEQGYMEWYCIVCGDYKYEYRELGSHDYEMVYAYPANCTDMGYEVWQCRNCLDMQYGYYDEWGNMIYPPLGHIWTVYIDSVQPTMGHYWECTRCGYLEWELHSGSPCACGYTGPVG